MNGFEDVNIAQSTLVHIHNIGFLSNKLPITMQNEDIFS